MNEATVIAYPVNSPSNRHMSNNNLMEENIYASSLGDSKFADDTIEMSGNFFSQLDSMIAAVKVESSALDSMKEKLREVESLRNQISMFTKRLLDADQANLNLKGNLVKVQEMYAEAKKAKAEVESSIVPIRAELNRTKDQCNKERMGRLAAQQQLAGMQDQINMLQQANENLDREVKTIPALTESNEILKNDLSQLRKRYKDEKAQMTKHIKTLETQARDVEAVKGCVRDLSMKLLDIANAGSNIATSGMNSGAGSAAFQAQQAMQQQQQRYQQQAQQQPRYVPPHLQHQPPPHHQQQQLQQQQQQSNVYYQYGFNPNNSGNSNNNNGAIHSSSTAANHSSSTAAEHSNGSDDENSYEDADDESYDPDDSEQNLTNEYENESFVEVNSSIESAGSVALISKAGAAVKNANNSNNGGGSGGGGGKKKKGVRRVGGAGAGAAQGNVVRQARASQPQPRMMQQLDPSGSNNNNMGAPGQYQQPPPQQQQQYRNTTGSASNNINYNNGGQQQQQQQQGMISSVSLPRI